MSRTTGRGVAALAALALLPALTACGAVAGGSAAQHRASGAPTTAAAAPADADTGAGPAVAEDADAAASTAGPEASTVCADRAVAVPLPAGFPSDLPLPKAAVVTGTQERSGHRLVVTAVSAAGFRPTLTFLQQRLPAAGYRLEDGEVEERDAESDFASAAVRGRWSVRELDGCGGDVVLTVLTAPAA